MFAASASLNHRGRQSRSKPVWWIALMIIVVLVATPSAQQPPPAFNAAPPAATSEALPSPTDVSLLVGRSTILNVGATIARVSLTVPDIADAMVTAPTQILIHGKQPGTISLFVWDKAGAIKTFEVTVRRDLSALKEQLAQLFPGESIAVHGSGKDVVLSGIVSGQYAIEKAAEVAAGYVDKKENVVNLLKQQEGVASNQVMLRVRFAEVSRSAMMELGASLFTGPTGYKDWIARATTQQFSAPNFTDLQRTADLDDNLVSAEGKYTLSDFLNIFIFNNKYNIGTVIRALSDKGLFQSLAEPNLIATNGKEASFLAGGEYPYPVVQPGASGTSVSIVFKEFGIRLRFTPTVLGGDLVNLKVEPEVSALDFSNAIVLQGFRIPALSTRRTQTEVELRDGQTFAIAGLLNNNVTDTMRKIPGIGDIPILGWFFKSKAMQKNQTELVVMITPTIIRKGSMGVSEGLPSPVVPFLGAPEHRLPPQAPYTGSPRYPANQPAPRDKNMTDASQPPAASPASANATADRPRPVANAPVSGVLTPVPGSNASAPAATAPETRAPATPPPAPAAAAPTVPAPKTAPPPAVTPVSAPAAPRKPSKDEIKAQKRLLEEQKRAEENAARQRAADEKRQEEADRVAARRAAEERVQADKLAKERAKREAEVAKKNDELARKKAVEDGKKEKAVAEAAARLKAAQAAYEAEMARVKSRGGVR